MKATNTQTNKKSAQETVRSFIKFCISVNAWICVDMRIDVQIFQMFLGQPGGKQVTFLLLISIYKDDVIALQLIINSVNY